MTRHRRPDPHLRRRAGRDLLLLDLGRPHGEHPVLVRGRASKPWLVGVPDPYDFRSPYHRWRARSPRRSSRGRWAPAALPPAEGAQAGHLAAGRQGPGDRQPRHHHDQRARRSGARLGLRDTWMRFTRVSTSARSRPRHRRRLDLAADALWTLARVTPSVSGSFDPAPRATPAGRSSAASTAAGSSAGTIRTWPRTAATARPSRARRLPGQGGRGGRAAQSGCAEALRSACRLPGHRASRCTIRAGDRPVERRGQQAGERPRARRRQMQAVAARTRTRGRRCSAPSRAPSRARASGGRPRGCCACSECGRSPAHAGPPARARGSGRGSAAPGGSASVVTIQLVPSATTTIAAAASRARARPAASRPRPSGGSRGRPPRTPPPRACPRRRASPSRRRRAAACRRAPAGRARRPVSRRRGRGQHRRAAASAVTSAMRCRPRTGAV